MTEKDIKIEGEETVDAVKEKRLLMQSTLRTQRTQSRLRPQELKTKSRLTKSQRLRRKIRW